jgi:small subunit ribosomal protein S9
MADDERQDQPEGQEPEAGAPGEPGGAADEAEGQEQAAPQEGAPSGDAATGDDAPDPGEAAAGADGGEQTPPTEGEAAAGEGKAPAAEGEAAAGEDEAPAAGDEASAAEADAPAAEGDAPAGEGQAPEQPRERAGRGRSGGEQQDEVIPGAHLEPDLVLEEQREAEGGEYADAGAAYAEEDGDAEPAGEAEEGEQPVAREPLDLAADARYIATGKRKSAIARVILKPGDGVYTINGRHLDQFFPRIRLQRMAQQPLETAGYNGRMDVVARIHGGGVSAQAGALRHGIARALVEADPNLRLELKRRGFLTRDPREKERKKAGLKKARKRPQFSKR